MCILKDFLLIILGAVLAYAFDLLKQSSIKKKERKDELNKICNEFIALCSKLDYYTKLWFDKFIEYHYYQRFIDLTKQPTISSLMIINKKDTEIINDKIAEIIIRTEYCFDEIHRMKTVDFGDDEDFVKNYKLEHDNTVFNNVSIEELKEKYKTENENAEKIIAERYEPVFERIKLKTRNLKEND